MSAFSAAAATGQALFCAIGVDDRGTKIAAGLVSFPQAEVLAQRQIPTKAALAEAMFGTGKYFNQFRFATVGTGISFCLVLDGKPFTVDHGDIGTMASSPLSVDCERFRHVSQQTLEDIASGPVLVTRYDQPRSAGLDSCQAALVAAEAVDHRFRHCQNLNKHPKHSH